MIESIDETVLKELEKLTGTNQVRVDRDVDLFGQRLLDSLGAVELTVALSESLGIELSPSDIDRDAWSTPRKIIDFVTERTARA
jgi:D-alanine--poly(phosphoribitol) ligase subunit 2